MARFDVLDPATCILRRYFLEASAGTGKTFAIEHIVPRILLESSDPSISLEEILVVTFTRAATRELRLRIYQNLLKVKTALEEKKGGPAYLQPFWETGELQLREAKRRIDEALYLFERSQVFTLHGFCLKMLKQFALETHFFSSADDEEECGRKEKLKEYIKDFLRAGIDPQFISSAQLQAAFRGSEKEIEALCDTLLKRLEGNVKIAKYPQASESWRAWNEALQSLPRVSQKTLWEDFSALVSHPASFRKRSRQAQAFFVWIEQGHIPFEEWNSLLEEKDFFLVGFDWASAAQKKEAKGHVFAYPQLFEKMQELFVPLYQSATDPSACLLLLARACQLHYEKGREDLSHFSPDDLVHTLESCLQKNPDLKQKIRSCYKAVIIDEFQDTDPSQWGIFESLFLHPEDMLPIVYLVGDPKQSIYAFRRADVYLYLKAASLLGSQSIAYLDTNFRSHPFLVEALNQLFSFQLPARWMLLPFSKDSLEVRRVLSKPIYPSLLDRDDKGRLHFFLIEEEGKGDKMWPKEETESKKIFPYLAQEILKLSQEKGFKLRQMAILVKDRFQAARLQTALKQWNLPCLMTKSLDVASSVAYGVMKDLLGAAARPSSLSHLKKMLGGALFGCTAEEVAGTLENPWLQRGKELLLEAASLLRKKGLGVFLQTLFSFPAIKGEGSLMEDLLSREDPHLYFDLRLLCQILLENCPEGLHDPVRLLRFLEELSLLPTGSEELKQGSEEEEDQIQVMTLHKSKGLEFDIVFALGVCSRHAKGEQFISVRKGEEREIAASSQAEEAFLLHREEADAEKLRQLYVALTRGKERVYVPVVVPTEPAPMEIGFGSPIELLLGGTGLSEYALDRVYANISSFSLEKLSLYCSELQKKASVSYEKVETLAVFEKRSSPFPPSLRPPPLLPARTDEQFLFSFSSLIEKREEPPFLLEIESPLEGDIPAGAETGTVVHAILEKLCKADLHRSLNARAQLVIEQSCKGSCLEGLESRLFDWMQEAVEAPLFSQGQRRLKDIPSCDMQTELEFLYPFQSSFLKGFIDLVFRFEGKYYLLDWKTNYLGPSKESYSFERIAQCMEESGYFLQAAIYTQALRKYLKLFHPEPFEELFGGVIYFFLRGAKSYIFSPDPLHLQQVDFLWKKT